MISGKEALIAFANGENVEYFDTRDAFKELGWADLSGMQAWLFVDEASKYFKFRLKPRTISLNGIEVPAPFDPKQEDWGDIDIYYLDSSQTDGWNGDLWNEYFDLDLIQFGAWRTEEEIKQVVEALRNVFNP